MPWIATLLAVLLLVLAGCGTDETGSPDPTDGASSSAPSDTSSPSDEAMPTPSPDPVLLSASAAGGAVDLTAMPLDDPADVEAFTGQFTRPQFARKVRRAIERFDVPDGQVLVGAVVAIGCQEPTGVTVVTDGEAVELHPHTPTGKEVQCLVPVTTVALAAVAKG